MTKAGVDDLYFGTESWDTQNVFSNFTGDFGNTNTRAQVLAKSDYNNHPKISVFVSETTLKELTGFTTGTLRSTQLKGVVLLFGYDQTNLVLVARSANGRSAKPSGSPFTDFNYKSPNVSINDSEVDTLISNFTGQGGYTVLANWAANQHPTITFDSNVLLDLLYSNAPGMGTPVSFHVVVAPPWSDDANAGNFISIVAQKSNIYRGNPPCPPYCYQNV